MRLGIATVLAVAAGQLVMRQLLQALPPGYTEVPCTAGILDCGNPALREAGPTAKYGCVNGTINPNGGSSQKGKPCACSPNQNLYKNPEDLLWTVIVGGIFSAVMAYLIGGNDAANSWGTSVGSKAISLRWAVCTGGFFEWLGATSLGYGVSGAVTKGVAKTSDSACWACGYCNSKMGMYSIAMLSALIAASIFMFLATFTAMPVSTTHAIIGGVVGATVVATGFNCLNWSFMNGLSGIIASWVISPVASGLIGIVLFLITINLIIKSEDPYKRALIAMPIEFGLGVFIIVMLVMFKSVPTKKLDKWIGAATGMAAGIVITIVTALFFVPYVKRQMDLNRGNIHLPNEEYDASDEEKKANESFLADPLFSRTSITISKSTIAMVNDPTSLDNTRNVSTATDGKESMAIEVDGSAAPARLETEMSKPYALGEAGRTSSIVVDPNFGVKEEWTAPQREAIWTYRYLLVFVAALESFAHGSNDTGNATGAFSAVLTNYQSGIYDCTQKSTPWYVMSIAGALVALGVITFGYRVIKTMGEGITAINFHRGWCMEFASAITVVACTALNMPVSTTHCQVGAVVFVGCVSVGYKHVDFGMFGKIVLTWVLTIPFAALVAAGLTAALRPAIQN